MTENENYASLEQAFSLGNGQETALNWLRKTKQSVAVFLISGIKLEGIVSGHDQYSLLLTDSHGNQQLIYKAKISTITQSSGLNASKAHSTNNRPQQRKFNQPRQDNNLDSSN
jgi:host factor-I protein